jgi:putative transposase
MARPRRLANPGTVSHGTSRGTARQRLDADEVERSTCLAVLDAVVRQDHWRCPALCLMDTHDHLLLETPEGNLSAGMLPLNGVSPQRFNRWHDRVGHRFHGRYQAIVVDREHSLLELCRAVVLHPVREGMVPAPAPYRWSSDVATVGRPAPAFLMTA